MIPFSPPHIRQEAIEEVVNTLRSGWITTGPKTKRFEQEITRYCGNATTLCVSSATFGLEIILRWFGVGPGDEVIIPAYTYCATANVVRHVGAKPVLVDVEDDTLTISATKVKAVITSRTKVIIPVDLAGYPADYTLLYNVIKDRDITGLFSPSTEIQKQLGRILILGDAAHSFGALYKGRKAGTFADITVFSFHAVKNITTGEGGAIALNLPGPFDNDSLYEYLNILSLHGQSKDALHKVTQGGWKYDVLVPGYKGNMTDIQASLGIIALKYYDSETLPRRKKIFEKYNAYFSAQLWARLPVTRTVIAESSYHAYLLRIKGINEKQRDEIIQDIYDHGVAVNVHYQPLPLLTAYQDYAIDDYPVSKKNFCCEISLPVYEDLSEEQVDKVIEVVSNSIKKVLIRNRNSL